MSESTMLLAIIAAAIIGVVAVAAILGARGRQGPAPEKPFAASTEGETRCPACGMGNLWTDETCVSCGARLG